MYLGLNLNLNHLQQYTINTCSILLTVYFVQRPINLLKIFTKTFLGNINKNRIQLYTTVAKDNSEGVLTFVFCFSVTTTSDAGDSQYCVGSHDRRVPGLCRLRVCLHTLSTQTETEQSHEVRIYNPTLVFLNLKLVLVV